MEDDIDWNQARAFLKTVETGSLSAAARALGLTQPTLSRQIAMLETGLGIVLFERVGKRLVLTESGRQLADHVKPMGEAADRFALAAKGQSQTIEGKVTITASDIMAAYILPPVLSRLREAAPAVSISVIASNSVDDLMRREADIALRHVPPSQPDLIARRFADSKVALYASRSAIDRFGPIAAPADIAKIPLIGFIETDGLDEELAKRGLPVTRQSFSWHCASALVTLEMVRNGMGAGIIFCEIADTLPDLVRIFPDMEPLYAPLWLVAHREVHASRRIRVVFDALAQALEQREMRGISRAVRENPG